MDHNDKHMKEPRLQKSLFVFTRDLRIDDNTGLIEACAKSDIVIPCIILDPKLVKDKNSFRIRFFLDCIENLRDKFEKRNAILQILYGDYTESVRNIIKIEKIEAVFINRDFTPFAQKRQNEFSQFCHQNNIPLLQYIDHLMYDPNLIKTQEGKPYSVFTQFFRSATQIQVPNMRKNNFRNFYSEELVDRPAIKSRLSSSIKDDRKNPLKILKNLKNFSDYQTKRNYPEYDTTMLSAHNRFGTISIREIYHAISNSLGRDHILINEIHWREFFSYILYHYPHIIKEPFRKKYCKITWRHNQDHFEAWKNGRTGFPIVDAGMRELEKTGFMHNRVRMIVASFLVKDLHIDWRIGERYFAKKLIDYDLAVNNGNWQWIASTGCDSQPWFRIFNPWLQQKKFDPNCRYIKKWVTELEALSAEKIHKLEMEPSDIDYPRPIIEHFTEAKIAKQMFVT